MKWLSGDPTILHLIIYRRGLNSWVKHVSKIPEVLALSCFYITVLVNTAASLSSIPKLAEKLQVSTLNPLSIYYSRFKQTELYFHTPVIRKLIQKLSQKD